MKAKRITKDNRQEINFVGGWNYILTCRQGRKFKNTYFCLLHKITRRIGILDNSKPLCPTCRQPMVLLGHKVRLPKKNASKWVWKNFVNLFKHKFETAKG